MSQLLSIFKPFNADFPPQSPARFLPESYLPQSTFTDVRGDRATAVWSALGGTHRSIPKCICVYLEAYIHSSRDQAPSASKWRMTQNSRKCRRYGSETRSSPSKCVSSCLGDINARWCEMIVSNIKDFREGSSGRILQEEAFI